MTAPPAPLAFAHARQGRRNPHPRPPLANWLPP